MISYPYDFSYFCLGHVRMRAKMHANIYVHMIGFATPRRRSESAWHPHAHVLIKQDTALLRVCGTHTMPNLDKIDQLIDAGADIKVRNDNSNTPLHLVCAYPAAVRHLVRKEEIDLYARNRQGKTPFHLASIEVLQILLWEGERGEPVPSLCLDGAPPAVTAAVTWLRDNLPWEAAVRYVTRLEKRHLKIDGDEHAKAVLPLIGGMQGLDTLCIGSVFNSDVIVRIVTDAPSSLTVLRIVSCSNITMLPDLSHLVNLRVLHLIFCSSLKTLPVSTGMLPNLTVLRLLGSRPLRSIPFNVIERADIRTGDDADAVLNYMVKLAMPLRARRLLIAHWGDGRRRRRESAPPISDAVELKVWCRLPREALANVLLWLS